MILEVYDLQPSDRVMVIGKPAHHDINLLKELGEIEEAETSVLLTCQALHKNAGDMLPDLMAHKFSGSTLFFRLKHYTIVTDGPRGGTHIVL
jgi:hypothetical protein